MLELIFAILLFWQVSGIPGTPDDQGSNTTQVTVASYTEDDSGVPLPPGPPRPPSE